MTASHPGKNPPAFWPMRGRSLQLLSVLLGVLALAGCDTRVAYVPKSTSTLTLSPDDHAPTTTLSVVTAVKFVLPGPVQTSGLSWVIVGNNITVLDQMDQLTYQPDHSSPLGGTTSIRFYALKPGRSIVRFVLVNPNAKEAIPVERYSILVVVKDE